MAYKAYLVYSSVATRVVVPEGSSDEEIFQAAVPNLISNLVVNGVDCLESFEEDTEMPYDPTTYPDKELSDDCVTKL